MTKLLSRCLLCLALLGAAGCQLITGLTDGSNCPARYAGRYGCVQVIVMIDAPPQPWPERYIFGLAAIPAREGTGLKGNYAASPNTGRNRLHLARHNSPHPDTDTASVWITARIVEHPPAGEYPTGVPFPVFAADSALYLADFGRTRVDTVRLTLRRP
jgi:hypothetical protein